MPVELYRIDDRLIHGQVVVGWGQPLDIKLIVMVDDEVACCDWEQDLYRMGVPPEMELRFADVATAVQQHPAYVKDPRHSIILTGNVATMHALLKGIGNVGHVNVGGLHHRPGRTQKLRYVFLSPEEEREMRDLIAAGVKVTAQDVPAARPRPDGGGPRFVRRRGEISMIASLIDVLPVVLLGALLGLDVVTFPQAMISRPIVAATVAGAFIGNPLAGLTMGATLELLALGMLPFGASKYPEWGSASVVGGVLYASQATNPSGALPASLLAALFTAVVSGWSMIKLRRLNASRAARMRNALDSGSADAIVGLQLFGLTADFVRGGAVTLGAMLAFRPVVPAIVGTWHSNPLYSRALVVAISVAVAAGAIWKIFHVIPGAKILFAAGLACGIGLILLR